MKFWKMHGLGNDYVVIDDRLELVDDAHLGRLARNLCLRKFSIGADGLLVVRKSRNADIMMRIFNSDGSEAEMCGNGIRCLAKYCYDNSIVREKVMIVETLAGNRRIELKKNSKNTALVRVNMGKPSFRRQDVPMIGQGECIDESVTVNDRELRITSLSMGNPHCVTLVEEVESFPVHTVGPLLEKHAYFPEGTNVEFVNIKSPEEIRIRTWERGVGETAACGTGACASVAATSRLGKTGSKVRVQLQGGELLVELEDSAILEGPVEKVFEAELFDEGV
jgi:diaminopimelate epimerase